MPATATTRPSTRRAALLAAALGTGLATALAPLAGCSATKPYTVELHNKSNSTIRAQIVHDPRLESDRTLETLDLLPGDTGTLGPVRVDNAGPVNLHVFRPAEIGLPPQTTRLSKGGWIYEAVDQADFGYKGVIVRKVGPSD